MLPFNINLKTKIIVIFLLFFLNFHGQNKHAFTGGLKNNIDMTRAADRIGRYSERSLSPLKSFLTKFV